MSKVPPTLADACAATLYDKSMPWAVEFKDVFRKVINARKMVLDAGMSGYLAELAFALSKGGLRKRLRGMENIRQLSKLPHALTWVELDNVAFINHQRKVWNKPYLFTTFGRETLVRPDEPLPPDAVPGQVGWLFESHGTAVKMWEVRVSTMKAHRAFVNPVGIGWSTNDDPVPWRASDHFKPDRGTSTSELASSMEGYITDKVCLIDIMPKSKEMMVAAGDARGNGLTSTGAMEIWSFLSTINDLPVRIEEVTPSRGWMARGNYRRFLQHSIVTLEVPQPKWRRLATAVTALLRRRAHQVRGHWRRDWRHPGLPGCDHTWSAGDDNLTCRRCGAVSLWVHEHQRGDTSLGFVTHDYEVVHQERAP